MVFRVDLDLNIFRILNSFFSILSPIILSSSFLIGDTYILRIDITTGNVKNLNVIERGINKPKVLPIKILVE